MSQPQQQQNQNRQPDKWQPHEHVVFLVECDDAFEKRARGHIERAFRPLKGRIVTHLNTQRLRPETEIVVVYQDPDADIVEDGQPRERDRGERKDGKVVRKAELPVIQMTAPVPCRDLWSEPDVDGINEMALGGVQLANMSDENGRVRPGLISRLTSAGFAKNYRGKDRAVYRVAHRPDNHEITIRAT